jgi:hypothetical protein
MTTMPASETGSAAAPARPNQLLALIPRWKWAFFATVGLLMLAAFNGHWRIGRDSAAYRGLAHQLVKTGKYLFRDKQDVAVYADQQDTRYPGMPLLLAGVERAFGRGDAPAVLCVTLASIATLLLSYRLLRPVVPPWLAIAVIFGMGANGRYLEHSNEVLSDVPFLLGVVGSLLSFERLQRARTVRSRAGAMTLLVIGLLFAAAMRPTFWVLALALVATCLWGLMRPTHADEPADNASPRRIACMLTLAVLLVAAAAFALVDPRGKTVSGGYENKMRLRFEDFQHRILEPLPQNVYAVLEQTLPEAFFGTQLGPGFIPVGGGHWIGLSAIFCLILIGSAILLARRNVLWGMFVLFTVLTMGAIGSVPRYFIMILPLLLAGWGLHINWLANRFKMYGAKEAMTFAGLGMVVIPNLISCANLIREQRGISRPQDGFKHVGFAQAYHGGKWLGVEQVARMIHDNVSERQKIFGPEATVLTFLSDRDVFGLGMFLPRKDRGGAWERKLRKMQKEFAYAYAIFPDTTAKLYDDKDVVTGKLIKLGMLKPTKTIATAGGYKLCEYQVVEIGKPKHHKRDLSAATQPKARRQRGAATTGPAATQPAPPRRRRGRPPTTTAPAVTQPAKPAVGWIGINEWTSSTC